MTGCAVKRGKPLATRKLPLCVTPVNTLAYHTIRSHAITTTTTEMETMDQGWLVSRASAWTVLRRYQNNNWLPIDYA